MEYVRNKGHSELVAEYVEIKLREADGSFNNARFAIFTIISFFFISVIYYECIYSCLINNF